MKKSVFDNKFAVSVSSREVGTGNLCRDPGKFFYVSKDFSGTDIYHSDIKMRYCRFNFFLFTKSYFSKFEKHFLRQYACEIKIFSSVCVKN